MVKQHLKRLASPRTWPIKKKTITFVARPNPGPHSMDYQLPISVFLRDVVEVVRTNKEVKYILHNGDCLIDGTLCRDDKRPVGLFDVVSLPKIKKHYRILINDKNKLHAVEVSEAESKTKISKITGKTTLKGNVTQLNTLDGRAYRVEKDTYKRGDVLLIELPSQKISQHIPFEQGSKILLIGGSHVGHTGVVDAVEGENIVVRDNDYVFKTKRGYAVVVGKDKPVITL